MIHPCDLKLAVGVREACPGVWCALWHGERCVLDPVAFEIRRSPALARHLLELRATLERAAFADGEQRAGSAFHRLLDDELAAGA